MGAVAPARGVPANRETLYTAAALGDGMTIIVLDMDVTVLSRKR